MKAKPAKPKQGPKPPPATPPVQPAAAAPGKPTGLRKWLYRLLAVTLVPAALFGLLELGLWTFGYGYRTSFFVARPGPGGTNTVYAENPEFGKRFFPLGLVRKPLTLSMSSTKPKGAYRIFILGESAAMGFPDPTASFARILEVMLRDAYPGEQFEIINTSITAINSHVVVPIARECAGHQPDLFIVHLGNNEVVGTFGAAGVLGTHAPNLRVIRASLAVKTTRTGQLIGNVLRVFSAGEEPKSWEGMEMYARSWVGVDDPRLDSTLDNFRQNLHDICHAGTGAGAGVLVCTIPVNLKDCAPFASLHRTDLNADRLAEWDKIYQEGVKLEDAGKHAEALSRFEQAASIDDRHADLAFRMGRCCLAQGKSAEARPHFLKARDLDALRFRTDTRINDAIRAVVADMPGDVRLVDAEADFAALSPAGIPGEDLFLEHVHMTFKGNHALAASLFKAIVKMREPQADALEPLDQNKCAERLAFVAWNRFKIDSTIRGMFHDPPFKTQLDQAERARRWDARLDAYKPSLEPAKLKESAAIYDKALLENSRDWMIRENYARMLLHHGANKQAIEHYQEALEQAPHHYTVYHELGVLLQATGNLNGAKLCFESALLLDPDNALSRYDLAKVLAAQGKTDVAVALFTRAANQQANRAESLALLSNFLHGVGKRTEAYQHLDEAMSINPNDATAHIVKGNLLAEDGDPHGAVKHYETAMRLKPTTAPAVSKFMEKLRKK